MPRGPADPNAPSGASTAGPPFVGGRFGANDCILQVADGLSTFDVCVLGYARHSQISEFLCMFLIFSVDLKNGRLNATSSLQKEWQHTKGRTQKAAMQEAESDLIKRFAFACFVSNQFVFSCFRKPKLEQINQNSSMILLQK